MDNKDILLAEWKEIRETLRYFGNKRFAQLTVFLAAEGATISAFLNPATTRPLVFQSAGLLLSGLFCMMEYSSVRYWKAYAERGSAIEAGLPPLEMMSKSRPRERWYGGTTATYFLYIVTAMFWLFSFGRWFVTPANVDTVRIVIAGDGRADYKTRPEDEDGINKVIAREIAQAVLNEKAQMLLWTGDLVNVTDGSSITLERELLAWRDIMQPLYDQNVTVLPVRGNHEVVWYDANWAPIKIPNAKTIWDKVFAGRYALPSNGPQDGNNVSFYHASNSVLCIGLDQYDDSDSPIRHSINQVWFDQVLGEHKKPFVFVYGHEPAFMVGNHADVLGTTPAHADTRNSMWESLIRAGARVYFCGHDHFYDHMMVVRNTSETGPDMHQLTAGTSGAPFVKGCAYKDDPGWKLTPVRHIDYTYGYILVVLEGNRATVNFKGRLAAGKYEVMDSFDYIASAQ